MKQLFFLLLIQQVVYSSEQTEIKLTRKNIENAVSKQIDLRRDEVKAGVNSIELVVVSPLNMKVGNVYSVAFNFKDNQNVLTLIEKNSSYNGQDPFNVVGKLMQLNKNSIIAQLVIMKSNND